MAEFNKFDWYRALAGADLTDAEFRLLVLMANYADGKTGKRIKQSFGNLAADLGKNVKTVKRTVPRLIEKGWLHLVEKRPGNTDEYGLCIPTGDTQMSPGTFTNQEPPGTDRGHPDVPPTGDISEGGGDTQMSPHRGHLDVPRSDQIRSLDQTSDHETPSGSLADAGSIQAAGPDSDPWGSASEPATGTNKGQPLEAGTEESADAREERADAWLQASTAGAPTGDPFA